MKKLPAERPYALVVDDDIDMRMTTMLVVQEKMAAVGAANGVEAIKVMTIALRHDNMPSLILLDLNMPYFNGWELLELLDVTQPKVRNIPVVVVTGEKIPNLNGGRFRVLRKPFEADDLLAEVGRVLESNPPT